MMGISNFSIFLLNGYDRELSAQWMTFFQPATTLMSNYIWSIDQIQNDLNTISLRYSDPQLIYARIPILRNVIAVDWVFSILCIFGTIAASVLDFLKDGKNISSIIIKQTKGIKFARNCGGWIDISLKGIIISYLLLTPVFGLIVLD
jgi:hypothetical protein